MSTKNPTTTTAAKVKQITPPEQTQEHAEPCEKCEACAEQEQGTPQLSEISALLWHAAARLEALSNNPDLLEDALTDANAKELVFLLDDIKTAEKACKKFRKTFKTYFEY